MTLLLLAIRKEVLIIFVFNTFAYMSNPVIDIANGVVLPHVPHCLSPPLQNPLSGEAVVIHTMVCVPGDDDNLS